MDSEILGKTYDRIAFNYSKTISQVNSEYTSFLLQIAPKKVNTFLDLGCGTGEMLKVFEKKYNNAFGLEPNLELLKIAKKNTTKAKILQGNAEDLPFKNEFFDYVISFAVFQHVDREKAITELKRVLKQKGEVVITEVLCDDFYQDSFHRLLFQLKRIASKLFLIKKVGLMHSQEITKYQGSEEWRGLTSIHKHRRFDFAGLKDFYTKNLTGSKFIQLSPRLFAVMWEKN